jgi:hypothetical protein
MTIDKALYSAPMGAPDEEEPMEVEVQETTVEPNDDGSVVVNLGPEEKPLAETGHDDNLAESVGEDDLVALASDLIADVDEDLRSRDEWEKTYKDGLKLLGLKIERRSEPWDGACGVVHPILAEAVVRFQSEMVTETFPALGPVKTKVLGSLTQEKEEAGIRVKEDMNIELTDRMTEYRSEHERMLWNLPIAGSALKKVYFDPTLQRQVSMFVAAEDFIVAYGASDLASCPRYTHVMKKTKNDVHKLMLSGFYKNMELTDPTNQTNAITEEKDKLSGQTTLTQVNYHTLYEINADLSIKGIDKDDEPAKPYIVTIDRDSQRIIAIRRNWDENDRLKIKKQHFVHYQYIPGFGFYGLGLIHLVGGFAEGATSLLRQLVDAGTLSNLPGGLKTRGLRIKGDDTPIGPGEWRDVDVPGGTLKENLLPLPYKEPSIVLAGLLDKIVEEGRKFAAIAEMKIQDFDSNSPVGTTMALLERTLKVMSAIQARVYDAMKSEFRLIKSLIRDFGTDEYEYDPETGTRAMKRADYDSVDVMPVADPNAATMSQRIVQWQAVMQLSATAPQIYDLPELHGQMLDILGVKNVDKLIPTRKSTMVSTDPVTENMNILNVQPVKAFLEQDHNAHLAVHQGMMNDPMIQQIVGQNPQAQQINGALMAHMMEHTAFAYRQQMEQHLGTQLPHPDEKLPPQIEVQLSSLIAQASQKMLLTNQNAAQQAQAQQAAQDPVMQQQMAEIKVKEADVQRKAMKDQADIQLERDKLELEKIKVHMETGASQIEIEQELERGKMEMAMEHEKHAMKMQMEREKTGMQLETQRMKTQADAEATHHKMAMDAHAREQDMQMRQFDAHHKMQDTARKTGEASAMSRIKMDEATTAAELRKKQAAKPQDKPEAKKDK